MASPIINFYKNKSVFVTGGTGFLGKVLIEKLLYSCRDINSIFLHIKPKHGKNIDDRMNELFQSLAFQRIHKEKPAALRKVIPIAGNLGEEQLGISNKDMTTLHNEVSVIFHTAAKIKFNYDLGPSVDINTKGTQKILNMCKGMKNLKGFVYVSTAYSNCPNKIIEEDIYDSGVSLSQLYETLKTADVNECKRLVGSRPNAYTFSKALAEEVIAKEARAYDIPATIVRPSFIMSAAKEPMPGWVENWYCWNAIVAGGARGVLRTAQGDPDVVPGLVPVDYVSNLCIAAAWDTNRRREKGDKRLKVFNGSSGLNDKMTHRDFMKECLRHGENIVKYSGPKPSVFMTESDRKFRIATFIMETIPAYLAQTWELITGKKSDWLQVYTRSRMVSDVCTVFFLVDYRFVNTNAQQLHKDLDASDAKTFDFNVRNINWDECLKNYVTGLNKYLMGK